jgi:hypothetical protein
MKISVFAVGILCLGLAIATAPGCGTEDGSSNKADGSQAGAGGAGGATGGAGGGAGASGGQAGTGGAAGATGGMDASPPGGSGPTYAEVQAIFRKVSFSCTICHTGGGAELPALFNVSSHESLLDDSKQCADKMTPRKRVKPGDAANSYVIHKLRGMMLCDGSKMPQIGGSPPSDEDIKKIEAWIDAGAKED